MERERESDSDRYVAKRKLDFQGPCLANKD